MKNECNKVNMSLINLLPGLGTQKLFLRIVTLEKLDQKLLKKYIRDC